jgi:hypothetical protein
MAGNHMALVRGREDFLVTVNGVEFLMRDGVREVTCRAALELLRHRFGSSDGLSDEAAFARNRETIESVASDKYSAGKTEAGPDPEIIITERDMASPLSRKI